MADKKTKRRYNSTRRKEQAARTRQQIVASARELFTEHGYSGTTIEAIASGAGVAPETIYATFGSKRAILIRLIEFSVGGAEEGTPLLHRSGPQAVQHESDQSQQIAMFAQQMYDIMQRMAPVFAVLRTAARTEPDIDDLRQQILAERLQGMAAFISALAANGPLRDGLTDQDAAQQVFALSSGELFSVLIDDLGWSAEQYVSWLAVTLTHALLG